MWATVDSAGATDDEFPRTPWIIIRRRDLRRPTSSLIVQRHEAPTGGCSLSSVDTGWRRVSKHGRSLAPMIVWRKTQAAGETDASGCLNRLNGLLKHRLSTAGETDADCLLK